MAERIPTCPLRVGDDEELLLGAVAVTAAELVHTTGGVDQLLLAREEGVTLRADFHLDILLGRTCLNHITAGACNRSLLIIGMDSFLHCSVHPFLKRIPPRSFHRRATVSIARRFSKCKSFLRFKEVYFSPG